MWGFPFFGPLFTIYIGIFAVPDVFTLSGVFNGCGLCFLIRASIWAFSNANLLASFSFISFSMCNHLGFSNGSLLASFSFNCLSVSVALFLSCNVFLKSHFLAYPGLASLTILSISISSSSGTFCLYVLALVLGFIYSMCAEHLLAYAISFALCLCFCPLVLYCIMFVLAKSK